MKKLLLSIFVLFSVLAWAQQPKSKAPEQGYVPEGWYPHEGGLLKYRVAIRFGEEPDTMPDGWKFGRVSAVTTDSKRRSLRVSSRPQSRCGGGLRRDGQIPALLG